MRNALLMDNIARNEGYGYPPRSLPLPDAENSGWWKSADAGMKQGWSEDLSSDQWNKLDAYLDDEPRRLAQLQMRMRSTLRLS